MHDCLLLPPPDESTDAHLFPLRCCAAELYRETYVKKVSHVEELATSINNGLLKLEQASADVDVMKVELREKEKVLAVAVAQSGHMLQEITTSTARAEKKKAEVQQVKDMLQKKIIQPGQWTKLLSRSTVANPDGSWQLVYSNPQVHINLKVLKGTSGHQITHISCCNKPTE